MYLISAVWTLIFLAALSFWWPRLRALTIGLLGAGYLLAAFAGLLGWPAGISLGLLIPAAYLIAPERERRWRIAGHVLFVALALGLGFHLLPGFHNLRVIGPLRLTPDAVPFTMYLNLDKPLAGFWLLLAWPAVRLRRGAWRGVRGVSIGLITATIALGLGVLAGEIAFEPKWPDVAWLWALNNLLLVCLTEEALFRGYLQEGLSHRLSERRHGEAVAIGISAVLFGVAHAGGGLGYALAAGLAGVGYGVAYRYGGLLAAVLAHFAVNVVHFTLFTYPMLAG